MYIYIYIYIIGHRLARAIEYTDYISASGGVTLTHNECPGYDIKQSDGEAPVMLEL